MTLSELEQFDEQEQFDKQERLDEPGQLDEQEQFELEQLEQEQLELEQLEQEQLEQEQFDDLLQLHGPVLIHQEQGPGEGRERRVSQSDVDAIDRMNEWSKRK